MTNSYSELAKNAILTSRDEAKRTNSRTLMPEHILLGIIGNSRTATAQIFTRRGVVLNALRHRLENSIAIHQNHECAEAGSISTTAAAAEWLTGVVPSRDIDRTLMLSQLEARMMRHSDITPEDIVLAMLKDKKSTVSQVLRMFDISYDTFHDSVLEMEGRKPLAVSDGETDEESNGGEDVEVTDEAWDNPFDNIMSDSDSNSRQTGAASVSNETRMSDTPTLDRFGYDMTQAAREGKLDPVIGRETEIERLAQILSRRKKNNPILLGEPGVGKTAIVEGLAQRIADRKVSFLLKDKRVVSLDMAGIVAGTKYRGQFEERLKNIMREVHDNPDVILYIDEIHTMVGAGNAEGSMDAANMLKPALSRGELQCIGATTLDEYRKTIEKDGALERRFQKVIVDPTTADDTLAILHNIRDRYEQHHCVRYTDDALKACVTLSDRYITDRNFPDKAIDVLDEAGSRMHLSSATMPSSFEALEKQIEDIRFQKDEAILGQHYEEAATLRDRERMLEEQLNEARQSLMQHERDNSPVIDAGTISETVAQMTGIPVQKVASTEGQKLLHLREVLKANVVGQDQAIDKVVRAIQRNRVGLKDPRKPIGTFLFLGPTGVGKTYLAKKIADELFATRDSIIRIDMSEYMEKYATSRLIGAAPGYVGYEEGGQLTERVRRHPYSVVLFDEIEKADKEVFNLMLQLFDEGHLTDSQGRKVDFKNCIIIMTSNVGSRQLGDFGTGIGFKEYTQEQEQAAAEGVIQKELKKTFSPEFLNRIDDIITFRQLSHDDIRHIVDVELQDVLPRIAQQGYDVEVTDAMKDFLASKGFDRKFGARPLKRAIQTHIEDAICERILSDTERDSADIDRHIVIDCPA
ncbi:MAG: ATP-dependent Clp protease ATP-binding subunit [Bacteroidales bacterium]|nr:ATP-dependent Clp protease ATP-binding subunit [Candidatus Liminaster caballi]